MDELTRIIGAGVDVIDLGRQLRVGMPQSPNHPAFMITHPRRHGDMVRGDGSSAANDFISMGTHVGTHIDALAHVSFNGLLHGGVPVEDAMVGGKFEQLGVDTVPPILRRGVLLDVAALLGEAPLAGGYEITAADLQGAAEREGVQIAEGDVVLVRSGWGQHFDKGEDYVGRASGVPGIAEEGAAWIADHGAYAVGADTIALERLAPMSGHSLLPAHRLLLVDRGIYIIEAMDLEELSRQKWYSFTIVIVPLNIYGATGSPVRPLAVRTAQ